MSRNAKPIVTFVTSAGKERTASDGHRQVATNGIRPEMAAPDTLISDGRAAQNPLFAQGAVAVMPGLQLSAPMKLTELFDIPPDTTSWDHGHQRTWNGPNTPIRDRPAFAGKDALIPKTKLAESLRKSYGLFLFAWNLPYPQFFIGVAANEGKAPPGILDGLRRRRIELTGTNMGLPALPEGRWAEMTCGGYPHLKPMQEPASQRYRELAHLGLLPDPCADVKVMFGTTTSHTRSHLKAIRAELFQSPLDVLWGGTGARFWPGSYPRALFCDRFTVTPVD